MRSAVLALALVLTACVGGGEDGVPEEIVTVVATELGAAPGDPVAGGPAAVESTPCPDPVGEEAECGFLVVAENRTRPDSQVIEVAWMRLPAVQPDTAPLREAPPLIVIPDGPGDSGLAEAGSWLESPLREGREVILLDPRGSGRSFPLLDCGQPPRPGALPLDLVEDCRRILEADGIDLTAYDALATAQDVADLRTALALGQVDVLGIGNGAGIALTLVRDHPEGVRAIVLDSPVPPEVDVYDQRALDAQASLNRLLDLCVQTRSCADAFGDLRPAVEAEVVVLNREAGQAEGDPVSGDDLVVAAVAAMRGLAGPAAVPAALHQAIDGDPEGALERLQDAAVQGAAVPRSDFSEGLRLSAECRDEVPFSAGDGSTVGLTPIGDAVAADVDALLAACAVWPSGTAEDLADEPVEGQVFALFLSGEFDPLSPPAWGAAAASRIQGATVVQIDGAGHRVHDINGCTLGLVADFLARPGATLDGTCARETVVEFALS